MGFLNVFFGDEIRLPYNHKILSADFSNMYTNNPVDQALALVKSPWDKHIKGTSNSNNSGNFWFHGDTDN